VSSSDGRRADDRPLGVRDALFAVAFAVYAAGAVVLLVQGLLAVAASTSGVVHEWLHVEALGSDWFARVAQRAADGAHDVPPGSQVVLDHLLSLLNLGFAALLLWLRPRNWTVRLLAVALVGAAGVFNLTAQATLEQVPLTTVEAVAQGGAHVVAGLAYLYALLLFPDGRPVPAWSRPRIVALYLPVTVAAVLLSVAVDGPARPATLLLFFGLIVPTAGAVAQAFRIRRGGGATDEAQARLLLWALVPSVTIGLAYVAVSGLPEGTAAFAGRHVPDPPTLLYRVFQPVFALIPIALFAGILRFRLWDIERLLNRTLVYGAVTGVLGAAYGTFVVVAELLLGSVAASPLIDSKPAVALTTLLFASGFRPLRDRVQRFVDRRFNRRRYDALITVEQFRDCLRDEVDGASIAVQLEAAVDRVIQPAHLSLWLCPAGDGRPTDAGSA
jgi:hypothetical protein